MPARSSSTDPLPPLPLATEGAPDAEIPADGAPPLDSLGTKQAPHAGESRLRVAWQLVNETLDDYSRDRGDAAAASPASRFFTVTSERSDRLSDEPVTPGCVLAAGLCALARQAPAFLLAIRLLGVTPLIAALNLSAALLIGLFGQSGSGKTYTMAQVAIGVHKRIGSKKPIVYFDTEKAGRHLRRLFKEAGIEVLYKESRTLADLTATMKFCRDGGSDVLMIDSLTHVYENFLQAYQQQKGRNRLQFEDWGLGDLVVDQLGLIDRAHPADLTAWRSLVERIKRPKPLLEILKPS